MATIYRILCVPNGKSYIGQTRNLRNRKYKHFGSLRNGNHDNKRLQDAFNIYGEDGFLVEPLETCDDSQDVMDEREKYWIEYYDSTNPQHGFNIASGGSCGYALYSMEPDEVARIRKQQKESHAKYYETHHGSRLGAHVSNETKEKLRRANIGENNYWYGKKNPDHSEEIRGGKNPRARKVVCLNTGETFECAKDASIRYSGNQACILMCCHGQLETSGSLNGERLKWKFA